MSARELLSDGPGGYVAARADAVKAAKAGGDKVLAAALKALPKPTVSLWAALAAGDEPALVRDAVAATTDLAAVQAGGADRAALTAATARRRELVERLIARAVADAKRWGDVTGGRRDEIRGIVDRLTRSPEILDQWLDATLRTLPDDAGGFSAFEGLTVASPPPRDRPPRRSSAGESAGESALVRRAERAVAAAERAAAAAADRLERAVIAAAAATAQLERARTAAAAADAEVERACTAVVEADADLVGRRDERRRLDQPDE